MVEPLAFPLTSPQATAALAARLAPLAPVGSLIVLLGPLGAGKTTLVQALGRVLGSSAQISSPSYTLIHEYPTPEGPLVHIDAYRLGGDAGEADALFELGLEDYLARARLVVAEWGEGLLEAVPDAIVVRLELGSGPQGEVRRASVSQRGKTLIEHL